MSSESLSIVSIISSCNKKERSQAFSLNRLLINDSYDLPSLQHVKNPIKYHFNLELNQAFIFG